MTTENLGTLVAKFELDTSSAQKSAQTASASIDRLEKQTAKTGDAFRLAAQRISPAGAAINGLASAAGAANPLISQLATSATGLATTLATSGPLGLAIAATGVAVAWLASKYQEASINAAAYHQAVRGEGIDAENAAKSFAEATAKALAYAKAGGGLGAQMDEAHEKLSAVKRQIRLTEDKIKENEALLKTEGVGYWRNLSGDVVPTSAAAAIKGDITALSEKLKKLKDSKVEYDKAIGNIGGLQIFAQAQDGAKKSADELAAALEKLKRANGGLGTFEDLMNAVDAAFGVNVDEANKRLANYWANVGEEMANAHRIQLEYIEEEAERRRLANQVAFEEAAEQGKEIGRLISSSLGLGQYSSKAIESFSEWRYSGASITRSLEGAASSLGPAGGVGLALEIVTAVHGAITSGFAEVASKVGEFDPRAGGALGAAAPLAGYSVMAMGGVLSAPTALPAAAAAAGVAFLELSKNTESYGHAQLKVQAAVDNLVVAIEPFWRGLYPATMAMQEFTRGVAPIIYEFSSLAGEGAGRAVFESFKLMGVNALSLAHGLATAYNIVNDVWSGADIDTGAIADSLAALKEMAYSQALSGDLLARRQRRAAEAADAFTDALQDATANIPQWYRYQSALWGSSAQTARVGGSVTSIQAVTRSGAPGPREWLGR